MNQLNQLDQIELEGIYYLSHPCTTFGDLKKNKDSARKIQSKLLEDFSISVINPLDAICGNLDWNQAMYQCYRMMDVCSGLILCKNWELSEGCLAEVAYATREDSNILQIFEYHEGKGLMPLSIEDATGVVVANTRVADQGFSVCENSRYYTVSFNGSNIKLFKNSGEQNSARRCIITHDENVQVEIIKNYPVDSAETFISKIRDYCEETDNRYINLSNFSGANCKNLVFRILSASQLEIQSPSENAEKGYVSIFLNETSCRFINKIFAFLDRKKQQYKCHGDWVNASSDFDSEFFYCRDVFNKCTTYEFDRLTFSFSSSSKETINSVKNPIIRYFPSSDCIILKKSGEEIQFNATEFQALKIFIQTHY